MLRSLKGFVRRVLRPALHKPDVCAPFHFFGTEYGGWPLLKSTPEGSLIYSFGIGEDISFDLESIERLKCIVHGFDPTPKSLAWIASQKLPSEFHFHRFGIADRDGEAARNGRSGPHVAAGSYGQAGADRNARNGLWHRCRCCYFCSHVDASGDNHLTRIGETA